MPTKTNDSPLNFPGHLLTGLASKAIGFAGGKLGGVIGKGLIKGAAKANPLGAAITGAQALFGGIKEVAQDRKAAKAAGEKYSFGEGLKDFGAGALKGATGVDLTDKDVYEQPEYTTNIDPMTGQEKPLNMKEENKDMPMMRPLKQLSPYTASYSAYNMSAKQASKEPLMQKLSGVSSLQFTDKGLEKLSAANIGGKFGAIVEAEKNKRDGKSPATMKRPVANPPKADKTRVNLPTGFKSNKELEEERSVQEHIDLAKSSFSDYAGYRSGDARNSKLISLGIKEHMKQNKKD